MALVRPRLIDHFGIARAQAELDFAIPIFNEDLPLHIDPFLLWKSPSQQDRALHAALIEEFNHLMRLTRAGRAREARELLIAASECPELGLGLSASRVGKRIGNRAADEILALFDQIPALAERGFTHIETLQLLIDGIGKDRISDITGSLLKSFLIDFTIDQCDRLRIPTADVEVSGVFDIRKPGLAASERVRLPINPMTSEPILFAPKRWLRFMPWIGYDGYFRDACPHDDIAHAGEPLGRAPVLNFNRLNYDVVEAYIRERERQAEDCHNDPLFSQIPIVSAKRALADLAKIKPGREDAAKYEDLMERLLPSLMYPQLDFAQAQSRTESGVSIRDLIFYNTRADPFLAEIGATYRSRQIVFEMKNVESVRSEDIDQLNRYLALELGNFGVVVTRQPLSRPRLQQAIDLWSGQRKAVVTLTDGDVAQMVELFETKQRRPLDVLIKKYVEFRRLCPV